ncbi:uncharacterized protein PGTG_16974, partial [Puccinia graminis f. sp. tritici CRL 75-36-700-3]
MYSRAVHALWRLGAGMGGLRCFESWQVCQNFQKFGDSRDSGGKVGLFEHNQVRRLSAATGADLQAAPDGLPRHHHRRRPAHTDRINSIGINPYRKTYLSADD